MKTTKNVVAKIAGVILAGMMVMGLASCGDEGAPSLVGKSFECSKTIQGEDVIATLNFTSETAGTMHYFVKGQSSGEVYRDLDIPFAYEAGNTPKTGDGSIAKAYPYHYLITWDESKFDKENGAEESWIRNANSLFFNIKEYKAAKEIAELKGGQGNERPSSGLQLYSFFSSSKNTIKKSCPFNAFVGLYMNGNISGIPATPGYVPLPNSNAARAISARNILLATLPPVPFTGTIGLWHSVSTVHHHDGQMDVVAGLYNHPTRLLV